MADRNRTEGDVKPLDNHITDVDEETVTAQDNHITDTDGTATPQDNHITETPKK
jgi:hypothetical protein